MSIWLGIGNEKVSTNLTGIKERETDHNGPTGPVTMQAIDINAVCRGMAPDLLYQSWRERLSGNPRLNMPSFADALNRIGFFYLLNCLMADSSPSMVKGYI